LEWLARHAGSAWVPFLPSSPRSALPRWKEDAAYSAQAVNYLSALPSDLRPVCSLFVLGGLELPMASERSDSAESLLAHSGILPEDFRSAILFERVSPLWPVFGQGLSANHQELVWLQSNLPERTSSLQPLHWAIHPGQHFRWTDARQASVGWTVFSVQQREPEGWLLRAIRLRHEVR
jgi:hypothetical protein